MTIDELEMSMHKRVICICIRRLHLRLQDLARCPRIQIRCVLGDQALGSLLWPSVRGTQVERGLACGSP